MFELHCVSIFYSSSLKATLSEIVLHTLNLTISLHNINIYI